MNEIVNYIAANGGFATMKELKDSGFHTRNILSLVQNRILDKIKPGLYRIADYSFFKDVNVSLLTVCKAETKGVICLVSALDFYELTTFNTSEVYYAIPNSAKRKTIIYPPVITFYFPENFYKSGIEIIKTKFGEIRIYNMEKTVCDMFRYRNKIGDDLCIEALKNYLNLRGKNIGKLIHYAEICQVKTILIPILKGLVAI